MQKEGKPPNLSTSYEIQRERSFDLGALLKKHAKKHKSKPAQYTSVAEGVTKRLENNVKRRKSHRLTVFDSIRNLPICESPIIETVKSEAHLKAEHRRMQLEKWKEEKEKKKKEIAALKKKPFLVGVAQSSLRFVPPPPLKNMPSTSGRVTRSQSAKNNIAKLKSDSKTALKPTTKTSKTQSFAPKNATFKPDLKIAAKLPTFGKVTKSKQPTMVTFDPVPAKEERPATARQTRLRNTKQTVNSDPPQSYVRGKGKVWQNKLAQKIVPESSTESSSSCDTKTQSSDSENMSSEKEVSMKTTPNIAISLASPLAKKIPRKSLQASKNVTPKNSVPKSESSSEEKLRSPKTSPVMKTPGNSSKESDNDSPYVTKSRGKDKARIEMKQKIDDGLLDEDANDLEKVDEFRRQLASEVGRLTELCNTWEKISEATPMPEAAMESVLSAVGLGRLLVSQKLRQFGGLVERAAARAGPGPLVTPADLHGFWDMVFMQVENVDMRFKKLEELKARNWIEEVPVVQKKGNVAKANVKKPVRAAGGPSRLREMIAAARKAKKQEVEEEVVPPAESKTFEAGFFSVSSPVRSPAVRSPAPSLLKAVLSSEAKKASASKNSMAMLRASLLGRYVDADGDELLLSPTPMTPINLFATPGRSILKSASVLKTAPSTKKSIKVVLFEDSDNEQSYLPTNDVPQEPQQLPQDDDTKMDVEKVLKVQNKENSSRKSKLIRQDAVDDRSPVMTRSRRKSLQTPKEEKQEGDKTHRRSARKVLQEPNDNSEQIPNETPKRSNRRRKSSISQVA